MIAGHLKMLTCRDTFPFSLSSNDFGGTNLCIILSQVNFSRNNRRNNRTLADFGLPTESNVPAEIIGEDRSTITFAARLRVPLRFNNQIAFGVFGVEVIY